MDGTILCQGTFRTPGTNTTNNTLAVGIPMYIQVPSGCDFIQVWDATNWANPGFNTVRFNGVSNAMLAVRWTWQLGMLPGTALVEYYANGSNTLTGDLLVSGGFTPYDPSNQQVTPSLSGPVAFTAISNAINPVVSTGSTAGLSVGSIVRLSHSTQTDTQGIDFYVSAVTANTNFTLLNGGFNELANSPGSVGGAGFYRIVNYPPLYYPRKLVIVNITSSPSFPNAIISTSIPHGLTVGQEVRFSIPDICGLTFLNPTSSNNYLTGTIIDSQFNDAFSFMVDIPIFSVGQTFTFPTVAQQPSQFPEVVPVGENTSVSLASLSPQVPLQNGLQIPNTQTGILADATVNTGFLGMILGSGGNGNTLGTPIEGPTGTVINVNNVQVPDVMYWRAGKSTFGGL